MNQTIDLIQAHRSIRKFSVKPIEADLLQQVLLAGQAASTSSFIQATTAIRVSDTKLREQLVELTGGQKYVASAAEFMVLCADLQRNKKSAALEGVQADYEWAEQFLAATVDVALFAQNMVIAAESAGLGCCYIGGIRNHPQQVSELLALPDLVYPVFGLCLGYPDQNPDKKPRLPSTVVLHENQYQGGPEVAQTIAGYDDFVRGYYQQRTGGRLNTSWSQQIAKQAEQQSRPFMLEFLQTRGFLKK